ncbi:unnamed protein product [Staurois parvus]|uniref:Secreted protein n=1 Tax=Staurois parvus TaxID=386267 RepID=A0ABN9E8F1_9NEOB|nr:unnamed protein product [Staurois parvus]
MAGRWQCRVGWSFINGLTALCLARSLVPLCPPDTVEHRLSDGTSVRGPDHVITDWPISDHMQK